MNTRNKVLATVIAGLISTSAFAATDGLLDTTSTGNINLNLEVLDSVQITSLDDVDFGQYGGTDSGDINDGDAYCVYRNGGDNYTITPTSANGQFSLTGPTGDFIDYVVKIADTPAGAPTAAPVAYGVASANFVGSNSRDCGAADNASVDVSIIESEITQASTGLYADILILLVSPI